MKLLGEPEYLPGLPKTPVFSRTPARRNVGLTHLEVAIAALMWQRPRTHSTDVESLVATLFALLGTS